MLTRREVVAGLVGAVVTGKALESAPRRGGTRGNAGNGNSANGAESSRGQPRLPARGEGVMERWLSGHPKLSARIAWVTGDGARQNFAQWTATQKGRVEDFFAKLGTGAAELGMKLPPGEASPGYYKADVAFDTFAAHVAHAIFVESKGLVPWKLEDRPDEEIDQILNSNGYFAMIRPSTKTYPNGITANQDFQDTAENAGLAEYISDPRIGFDFLTGKTSRSGTSLVGKDPVETLKNLTIWLRDNVDHADIDGQNGERAKKLRWLDERLRAYPGQKTAMANLGCHSASKLMVDLARSVNIPLLHTRTLDATTGNTPVHFLSRTHGSLVFQWAGDGGEKPLFVWHTDTIYAREGKICFPVDERAGRLLTKEQADQLYFETVWMPPEEWKKVGFIYDLQRVFPDQGYGHNSDGAAEERDEYGTMAGRWAAMGNANQDELLEWLQDYAIGGSPLLDLSARQVVTAQLTIDFQQERGRMRPNDPPKMPTYQQYETRGALGVKLVGGAAGLAKAEKDLAAKRGSNLLKAGVRYDGRTR